MKISKVTASIDVKEREVSESVESSPVEVAGVESTVSKYADGISHIKQAIDALGVLASEDKNAHDAILDLAVVCAYLQDEE